MFLRVMYSSSQTHSILLSLTVHTHDLLEHSDSEDVSTSNTVDFSFYVLSRHSFDEVFTSINFSPHVLITQDIAVP